MAKHTITAYVYQVDYGFSTEPEYKVYNTDTMGSAYSAMVGPVEVTFTVPDDFDPRPGKIAALEAKKQELRAEFAAKVTEIERKISELLAITNEVA